MLKVGGVQQILLHVKVMEVSRTKLRELGFDFWTNNKSFFVASSPSGLLNANSAAGQTVGGFGAPATSAAGDSVRFGIAGDSASFFGFIDALRTYQLAKVMAEPTIVTVSGRPAYFNSGGEFPILIPSGLGTVSVDFKKFGTQVDFVPIVLGNVPIRLDVKPRISFLDNTLSVTTQGITIPGLNVREVDTSVEMKAGQTLAIAGLVQNRMEYSNSGIPYLSDLPYFGALFAAKVSEEKQRNRTGRDGHSRTGRADGCLRRARVRAGHGEPRTERLRTVLEGKCGTSLLRSLLGQRLPVGRRTQWGGQRRARSRSDPGRQWPAVRSVGQRQIGIQRPADVGSLGPVAIGQERVVQPLQSLAAAECSLGSGCYGAKSHRPRRL